MAIEYKEDRYSKYGKVVKYEPRRECPLSDRWMLYGDLIIASVGSIYIPVLCLYGALFAGGKTFILIFVFIVPAMLIPVALKSYYQIKGASVFVIYEDGFIPPSPHKGFFILHTGKKIHFDEIESILIDRKGPSRNIVVVFKDILPYRIGGYYYHHSHYAEPYFMTRKMPLPDDIKGIVVMTNRKEYKGILGKLQWFCLPEISFHIDEEELNGISTRDLLITINRYYGGKVWHPTEEELRGY